jgi:hypothetical protein
VAAAMVEWSLSSEEPDRSAAVSKELVGVEHAVPKPRLDILEALVWEEDLEEVLVLTGIPRAAPHLAARPRGR